MGIMGNRCKVGWVRKNINVVVRAVLVSGLNHEVPMKIPHIKLGFRNASSLKHLVICDDLLAKLGNLPAAAQQRMDLPKLKATVATAHASRQRIQMLKADLKHQVAAHKLHLRACREETKKVGWSVLANAHAQRQAITDTGLPLAAPWKKVGVPAAPLNVTARATEFAGEIRLDWKRPVRRCLFHVEFTTDPTNEKGWKIASGSRAQSFTVPGLVAGKVYWFRVRAENIHGKSPWSNLASARVR